MQLQASFPYFAFNFSCSIERDSIAYRITKQEIQQTVQMLEINTKLQFKLQLVCWILNDSESVNTCDSCKYISINIACLFPTSSAMRLCSQQSLTLFLFHRFRMQNSTSQTSCLLYTLAELLKQPIKREHALTETSDINVEQTVQRSNCRMSTNCKSNIHLFMHLFLKK